MVARPSECAVDGHEPSSQAVWINDRERTEMSTQRRGTLMRSRQSFSELGIRAWVEVQVLQQSFLRWTDKGRSGYVY
jgi:hypothetical protein